MLLRRPSSSGTFLDLPRVLPWVMLLALTPACHTAKEGERDVQTLVREGRYAKALRQAQEAHRHRPGDAEVVEDYRIASAAALLERGRRLLFEDRSEEALAQFLEARELAPEEDVIGDWIYNASERLALQRYRSGMTAQGSGELDRAVELFEQSLEYLPGYSRAESALARTLLQLNYRAGMGQDYYDEGVRDLRDHFLNEAEFGFSAALKYDPGLERAAERRQRTRVQLAEERAALALALEGQGAYAAARNEHRMALLLDLDCEEAQRGYARADREASAAEALREADWAIMRGDYDGAREALTRGRDLTEEQVEDFDALEVAITEAHHADLYERARTLESDEDYEGAVAAYADLLERATFFRDAITRKATLESYIADAADLYERARAETTDEGRARFLRRIAVFWPGYLDVGEQLEVLEARLSSNP